MAPNHKLTNVIKGRKVVGTSNEDGKMILTFDDGSTLRIKTGTDSNATQSSTGTLETSVSNTQAPSQTSVNASQPGRLTHAFTDNSAPDNAAQDAPSVQGQPETTAGEQVSTTRVSSNNASTGGTVKSVMQGDTTIMLQFEDGGKMDIPLAEASSSVMLRGKDNLMEYAD